MDQEATIGPPDPLRVANAITAALCGTGSVTSALEALRELVPFDAAMLSSVDLPTRALEPVWRTGYDDVVASYANDAYRRCPSFAVSVRAPDPMRMRDYPFDFRRLRTYCEILGPAGFEEGVTTVLRRPSGEQVGMLVLSHRDPGGIDDRQCRTVGALAPLLAHLVDDRPRLSPPGSDVRVLATIADDMTIRCFDSVGELLLHECAELVPVALHLLRGETRSWSGLVQVHSRWWRIEVVQTTDAHAAKPRAVAVVRGAQRELQRGLTGRELQVLDQIVAGSSNAGIADALTISPRTVTTHVEHLLSKLGAPNRAAAAVFAAVNGLQLLR